MTKNQLEKAKRNSTSAEKDLNDSKNKEKDLRQILKSKDELILSLQTDLASSGQSYKSTEQTSKFELEKTKEEL